MGAAAPEELSALNGVHLPDDALIEIHTVGQGALEDIFVEAVDGAVLLLVDVEGREADAVGADVLIELGVGAAGHDVGADLDAGVDLGGDLLDEPELLRFEAHHGTGASS